MALGAVRAAAVRFTKYFAPARGMITDEVAVVAVGLQLGVSPVESMAVGLGG